MSAIFDDEPTTRDEALHALTVQADDIVAQWVPVKVETAEQVQKVTEVMVLGQRYIKNLNDQDDQFCKPLYDHWKFMKGEFTKRRKPVEQVVDAAKAALSDYRRREVEAQAAEQKRLNAQAQKRFDRAQASGKGTPLPVPVAPIVQDTGKRVETALGTTTMVDNYLPEIMDETKIPREYLVPDMAKLKATCKAGIEVPGVQRVNHPYPVTR